MSWMKHSDGPAEVSRVLLPLMIDRSWIGGTLVPGWWIGDKGPYCRCSSGFDGERSGGDGKQKKAFRGTYIRMSSDLLDDGIIEMPGVTHEITSNLICVLDALEDISRERELPSFSEFSSDILALEVDVLHPAVVVGGSSLSDVLLEDDDVGIGDFDGVG